MIYIFFTVKIHIYYNLKKYVIHDVKIHNLSWNMLKNLFTFQRMNIPWFVLWWFFFIVTLEFYFKYVTW
jgi:hypothetical protein